MFTNLTGQTIGRYHLLEQFSEGGMATVYKAFDTQVERQVAIKFICTEKLGEENIEVIFKRFKREARLLAKLSHPNILTLLDYGEFEGQLYQVTNYCPSGSLGNRMGKPVPWQEAARLLAPIARALEYAHNQHVLHCDIKPSNILLSGGDIPILADFGIAKALESERTRDQPRSAQAPPNQLAQTDTGILGTPEYMAPEQGRGLVDQRSDVYSLGIVFYELITGRTPFMADTPLAVMLMHASDPLPSLRKLVPDLPARVERVIIKALSKQPEDRYQDMGEFANILEGLALDSKHPALPATLNRLISATRNTLREFAESTAQHRSKWLSWLAGTGMVAILLTLAWTNQQTLEPKQPPIILASPISSTPVSDPTKTVTPLPTLDSGIQHALDLIRYKAPLYKTTFDFRGDFWRTNGNIEIEDGKLIANSELSAQASASYPILSSDKFAVTFEFRIVKSNYQNGRCIFETNNEQIGKSNGRAIRAEFWSDGSATLSRYVYPDEYEQLSVGANRSEVSTPNAVTLIILRNRIAAFINGKIAYTAIDPSGRAVYTNQLLAASETVSCEFDSFKLWDLTGIAP